MANFTGLDYLGQVFFYIAAGIFSVAGIFIFYYLFKQRSIRKAINTMGFSILLAAFAGGFSVPAINPYIGYRDVCQRAVELSEEKGLEHFHSLYLRRSENTDVFLGEKIRQLDDRQDPIAQLEGLHHTVVMMSERHINRRPELARYLQDKETHTVGPYKIVVLE